MKPQAQPQAHPSLLGYLVVGGILSAVVYFLALPVFALILAIVTPKNPINPAIYPAMRAAENRCINETYEERTVKCAKLTAVLSQCTATERGCSPAEYYGDMIEFGFDLPPLYTSAP